MSLRSGKDAVQACDTGPYPGLVRYYTEEQGWTLLRTVERKGTTAYGFQRRAEPRHTDQLKILISF